MKHDDIRHKLSEYIDGAVTADEKTIIEEHLASCRECSDALGELQKALQHIRDLEEMDSPPWLTQKIMTTVREEAEHKTGFFRKLFFPLHIKLPIQAVTVLFLTVTAFYISQSIQPAMRTAQAPTEEMTDRPTRPDPERLPQSPEYRALDMQYSYKPVPPPVPQEDVAASSAVSENAKRKAEPEAEAPSPHAEGFAQEPTIASQPKERKAARPMTADETRERAAEPPVASREEYRAKSTEPQKAAAPEPEVQVLGKLHDTGPAHTITVIVQNLGTAVHDIEKAVTKVGGKIIRTDSTGNRRVLLATLDAGRLQELSSELKRIGELVPPEPAASGGEGEITVRIECLNVE